MRNLSLGRRHLVNAYEVEAGIGVIAGNTVWSMPECLECEVLQKARYINTLTFTFYLYGVRNHFTPKPLTVSCNIAVFSIPVSRASLWPISEARWEIAIRSAYDVRVSIRRMRPCAWSPTIRCQYSNRHYLPSDIAKVRRFNLAGVDPFDPRRSAHRSQMLLALAVFRASWLSSATDFPRWRFTQIKIFYK